MNISILLATYKRTQILSKTLESFCLLNIEGLDWEILLIDNADDKATKNVAEDFKKRLPITYLVERKQGKNNALNFALSFAQGDLFVFTDDDVIADKNWLKEVWAGSKRWPECDIFGGKILSKWPSGKRLSINVDNDFFHAAYPMADWGEQEKIYPAERAWGANLAIRKNAFNGQSKWKFNPEVGPCGDNYVVGSETDLLCRLKESGFKAVYLPKAVVWHKIRQEQLAPQWLYGRAFKRGREYFYHYEHPNVAMLFGYPRYLIRQLLELSAKRFISALSVNETKRVNLGIKYWFVKGKIYQYNIKKKVKNRKCLV
jgi:cellulose synthase/poly-beta-1,6-N-acetylglucosamine synthase-like glycosyltransferase